MILVWNFLLERVKFEKINEVIWWNFVIYGIIILLIFIFKDEILEVKDGVVDSKKEFLKDWLKIFKNDREVFWRDGILVKSIVVREWRGRILVWNLVKDLLEKEKEVDRLL